MTNPIIMKRSAVADQVPTTSDLALGELAINTYDGKIYMKRTNSTSTIVQEIGAGAGGVTNLSTTRYNDFYYIGSSTGSGIYVYQATTTLAGLLNPTDKTQLSLMKMAGNNVVAGGYAHTNAGTGPNPGNVYDVCLGYYAGYNAVSGYNNVYVGAYSGYQGVNATKNVAIGKHALEKNTSNEMVAVGYGALTANTSGYANTALGLNALKYCSTGYKNTGIGYEASYNNSTGYGNTSLGYQAGRVTSYGDFNISLGYAANPSSSGANNQCTLGSTLISSLRCNDTTISSLSDRRDKTEIIDSPYGLDFLMTIKPRQFKWDTRDGNVKDGRTRLGFISQEFLESCDGNNDVLDLVMEDNLERLEAKYGNLLPIIVQSIKDLKAENDALRTRLDLAGL